VPLFGPAWKTGDSITVIFKAKGMGYMMVDLKTILKNKAINGWGLFWLVSTPISAIIAYETMITDLSGGEGVSHMIGFSVRFAIPFIFLVVAGSSVQTLFPGAFASWWLRNRKYIGLCFASAMVWQGVFIYSVSTFYRDYYYGDIYLFRDELEGSVGYIFLASMVVTSFHFGRKYITLAQWKLIHKAGIYFLFAYPFSVYWWNLFYYPTLEPFNDPRLLDYIFYWMGFIAFTLRIAAWGKKRLKAASKNTPEATTPLALKALGSILIVAGLVVSATGLHWQKAASGFIESYEFSAEMILWLPYWPLEPFLSLFILGLGTLLATKVRGSA